MNRTKIEWVKNPDGTQGYTLNDKTGCLNRTPEGLCLGGMFPCYAYKLANGRLRQHYLANKNLSYDYLAIKRGFDREPEPFDDPFFPRYWAERLKQPYKIKKPCGIFLDDMSDWMGDYWPREWTEQELKMMRDNPQHRFYTLTKQPQNLIKFSPFPENCWVGMTATNQNAYWGAITALAKIDCKLRYISLEPLLKQIEVGDGIKYIDWVIIGAQTKPYKPPKIEWIEEIVRACDKAHIPVFLKNNLVPILEVREPFIETTKSYSKFPRQEMPHA